jgi:hypothetical protein
MYKNRLRPDSDSGVYIAICYDRIRKITILQYIQANSIAFIQQGYKLSSASFDEEN